MLQEKEKKNSTGRQAGIEGSRQTGHLQVFNCLHPPPRPSRLRLFYERRDPEAAPHTAQGLPFLSPGWALCPGAASLPTPSSLWGPEVDLLDSVLTLWAGRWGPEDEGPVEATAE